MSDNRRGAPPPGYHWVFRPWKHDRTGRKIHASWFGKRAFRWLEADDNERND